MAKQVGPFKFLGKLGEWFGYLLNGEYHVRRIGKVDKKVRQEGPQYEETRKNEAEFGIATKCGGLFRQAMMHITQRWTTKHYPPKVIQLMMETLKSDTVHVKGKRSVNFGLKNAEAQMAFRRLDIYTKKNYTHYRGSLMNETKDAMVWKMNHQALWSRRDDGDTKSVKFGFLHVDFDRKIAKYEDGLTITCKRNEKIEYSELQIAPSGDIKLPWTFVIQQVWRDGDIYEPTGMLFMNVLQVIEGEMNMEDGLHGSDVLDEIGGYCVDEYGALGLGVHSITRNGHQGRNILDENGVNWDVFLDGYLGDGFNEWALGDEENKGLDVTEDVVDDSEEELDMQVVLGLCGVDVADTYTEQVLNEVEIVDENCEKELYESEDLVEHSDHGLHHEEELDMPVMLELCGIEVADKYTEQELNEVNVIDERGEKELDCYDDIELQMEPELFGVEHGNVQRGDVLLSLHDGIRENGGLERFSVAMLYETSAFELQKLKKKRFLKDSVKGQKIQRLNGRRLALQET
ncbi:MAG TPA: hypothetical protein VK169_10945 [Saprospiraceae bacterium]|nr:hypothetical protein [Saprospiraceae bacterium]